jgi:uncharacterized protein YodC (DUF2158 family)
MTEASFRAGDQVVLQSGGPSMTVETVNGSHVTCSWFSGSELKRDVFPQAALIGKESYLAEREARRRRTTIDIF